MSLSLASRMCLRHLMSSIRQIGDLSKEPSYENLISIKNHSGEELVEIDSDALQQIISAPNIDMGNIKIVYSMLGTILCEHAKAADVALAAKYLNMHHATRTKELEALEKSNPEQHTVVKSAMAWCKQVKLQRDRTAYSWCDFPKKKKRNKRRGKKKHGHSHR